MESVNKLTFFQKLKVIKAEYLVKEAKRFKEIGRFQKSIKYLLKAQKTFNHVLKEDVVDVIILSNIGDAYFKMYHYKKALDHFLLAEQKYFEKQMDKQNLLYKIYQNIATCYKQLRNLEKYIEYLNICIDIEKEEKYKATIYIELSHSYRLLKKYDQALSYSSHALDIYQKCYPEQSFEMGHGYLAFALIFLDKYDYKEAVSFLERTEEIFNNISVSEKHLINLYELLEYAYLKLGYKETAVFYAGKTKKLLQKKS